PCTTPRGSWSTTRPRPRSGPSCRRSGLAAERGARNLPVDLSIPADPFVDRVTATRRQPVRSGPFDQGDTTMAQCLLSVWHDADYGLDFASDDAQRMVAQVGAFNDQVQAAGAWVFGGGLHPASSATVVRSTAGDVSMTDGPYAESKEQMGGFWVIEAA